MQRCHMNQLYGRSCTDDLFKEAVLENAFVELKAHGFENELHQIVALASAMEVRPRSRRFD